MEKTKRFEKKDHRWQELYFYEIKQDKYEGKIINLVFRTTRQIGYHSYMDWCFKDYNHLMLGRIDELLEWGDINYGIENFLNYNPLMEISGFTHFDNPEDVYNEVDCILEDNQGAYELSLYDVTEDTPCGFYFGIKERI